MFPSPACAKSPPPPPPLQVVMPNKASQVALIDSDKGNILDVRTRRFLRSVPRWNGSVTRDGKYGLFAPARGGLEASRGVKLYRLSLELVGWSLVQSIAERVLY